MRKRFYCSLFLTACLVVPTIAGALSLESRAVIEEMRSRLHSHKHMPLELESQELAADSEYVPGRELREALLRLRKNLYPQAHSYVSMPVKSVIAKKVAADTSGTDYIPGKELAASLEKIRSSRDILRMIKLIKAAGSAVHAHSAGAVFLEPSTSRVSESEVINTAAEPYEPADKRSGDEPLTSVAAVSDRKSSTDLLRAADLKLSSKLSHARPDVASDLPQEVPAVQLPRKNEEEDKINEELSQFEFKMPSNYRIRVR